MQYIAGALVLVVILGTECLGLIDQPLATVTCGKLEALKLGASADDVVALFGPPVSWAPSRPEILVDAPNVRSTDAWWEYSHRSWPAGGVRFKVEFREGRLVRAWIFLKTFIHDRGEPMWEVNPSGQYSTDVFPKYMCRDGQRVSTLHFDRIAVAGLFLASPFGWLAYRRQRRVRTGGADHEGEGFFGHVFSLVV